MPAEDKRQKLLIIGLDGLEHTLVLRWGLLKLTQEFCGRFHVGKISRLYTPLIWSSILCGFNVEERGYDYEKAVTKSMGKLGPLHILKRYIMGGKERLWLVRGLLKKLGLLEPPNFIMPQRLLKETFLERTKAARRADVFALEVPGYSERVNGALRLEMTETAVSPAVATKTKFIAKVKQDVLRRLRDTKEELNKHNLVMCYAPLPDLAHHLFFRGKMDRIRILEIYKWIESNVSRVLLRHAYDLGFNVLILSDHGFDAKEYDHSSYGFWSTNFQAKIQAFEEVSDCVLDLFDVEG